MWIYNARFGGEDLQEVWEKQTKADAPELIAFRNIRTA